MIEVEVKAPAGPGTVRAVEERGRRRGVEEQEDVYFRHPCRDLAEADEALRVRRTDAGASLTYKGPRRGGETKTREEVEVAVDGAESARAVLEALGFEPLPPVRKTRTRYEVGDWTVCLDEVEGLGSFVELDQVVEPAADVDALEAEALDLLDELEAGDPEPRSYLELLLAGD